jgi:hypothetical protein
VKTALIVVVTALVTIVSPTAAQYGWIGVFADRGGCICEIDDRSPNVVVVYVVHRQIMTGVKGSRFTVEGEGTFLTHLYENPVGDPIYIQGDIVDGYTVSYGECRTGGLAIIEIGYFGQGMSEICSRLRVVAAPTAATGQVEVFDCNDDVFPVSGYVAIVNSTAECWCSDPYCRPVPVEDSTWGTIKALYR